MLGGGGAVSAMNSSINNNKKQWARRKERVKNVKDYFLNTQVKAKSALISKKVSKEKLSQIKAQIKAKAQKRNRRYFIFLASMSLVFICLLIKFFLFIN